jgi:hypothetical protein
MAEKSLFFNSAPGDERTYQASDFASYFGNVLSTGLLHTDEIPALEVKCEGTDLRTYVEPGKAIMQGYAYENTSNLYLDHALPEATLDRIDRIILRLDKRNQSRFIKLFVVQGVADDNPVPPALTRDEFIHEISLAHIRVRANTSTLSPADLVDERLDENLCGLVYSLISIPTSQFQTEWDNWFNTSTASFEQQFNAWFDDIQTTGFVSQTQYDEDNQYQASEIVRLSRKNTEQDKEIAYLKLQQEASARIENGTTFADDFNGNSFGITFDDVNSTNIVQRDGGLIMAESTQTTQTVTDATVVNQAYDTSGNGGRKLVRLENGWVVALVSDSSTSAKHVARLFVSKDNGLTFNQLCLVEHATNAFKYPNIQSKGNTVYLVGVRTTSPHEARLFVINAETVVNENVYGAGGTLIFSDTEFQSTSLLIDGESIHLSASTKNPSYPNSFNIRYAKGTINGDGSVTWGSVEQVTIQNGTSNVGVYEPSITLNASGDPVIVAIKDSSGRHDYVHSYIKSGGTWSYYTIQEAVMDMTQSSPSAIFVPQSVNGLANGRIWVAWHGKDSTDDNYNNVRVSYSDDGGATWSTMQKLTSGNATTQWYASITCNPDNKVSVVFYGAADSPYLDLRSIHNINGTWGAINNIKTSVTGALIDPSTLFDPTFTFDFDGPLFIYQDGESSKVGFYGTWTVGAETPTLTGTAQFTLPSTDYVGAFVQREGSVNVEAYVNDTLMDSELDVDEYMVTKQLTVEAPVTLRLELSRADTSGGEGDKVTRILGGIS